MPGGVAILEAVFEALGIESMRVSESALREGLLFDLVGRTRHADIRGRSIAALATRHAVDAAHAVRVERTARAIFDRVAGPWGLGEEDASMLAWAARLHEVGLAISHSQYHKHGDYIVRNADLLGFSTTEQQRLAVLVRAHRRKFPEAEFEALPKADAAKSRRLALVLRLAVLLHRSRTPAAIPSIAIAATDGGLASRSPRGGLPLIP